MTPVPSTDPADFLLNVKTFDTAINSTSSTFVDRLGVTRSTLEGAIDSLKAWNERGQWLTATAYAVKDVYTDSGLAYAVLIAHTSTSIAADLAAGKVSIHQGVTFAELAATSGASGVGYINSGFGAVATTVQDTLSKRFIIADDFISTSNTAAQNVTGWAALVDHIDTLAAGAHVQVSRGTYLFNSPIAHPKYTIVAGEGRLSTVFSFSNAGDGIQSTSTINGSTGVYVNLRDIGIISTNAASTGGGFVDVAGTFVDIDNVYFSGFKYNVIFDQTEIATINKSHFLTPDGGAGIWLVNGADHTAGALANFTNRITITCNEFNATAAATANILDDGGVCHSILNNNFNAGIVGIRAAGVQGLVIQGNESEVHANCDVQLYDTKSTGAYIGPCYGFDISTNTLISSGGGKNIEIQNAVNGRISSNAFGQAIAAVSFPNGASNPSVGITIENNGKLITGTYRSSGAFVSGFSRSYRQNTIRQTAVTYIAASTGAGTVTLTPANMEFISPGTRLRLANEDGSNGEDTFVTATTATTFTAVLATAKAANFLLYGATPADQEQGVWTPILAGATTAGTNTYTTQKGVWSRRGNTVTLSATVEVSAKDAAMAGQLRIRGIPFLPDAITGSVASYGTCVGTGWTSAGYSQLNIQAAANSADMPIIMTGSAVALNVLGSANLPGTTCSFYISVTYTTAQ